MGQQVCGCDPGYVENLEHLKISKQINYDECPTTAQNCRQFWCNDKQCLNLYTAGASGYHCGCDS